MLRDGTWRSGVFPGAPRWSGCWSGLLLATLRCAGSRRSIRVPVARHPRYRWSARALRWGGLAAGLRLPRPEYVPIEEPQPILAWLAATLRAGRTPYLDTFASSGVRLAQAALQSGFDLRGARLAVSGEPVTATRLAAIRAAGLEAVSRSGAAEAGHLGYGCLAPAAAW